MKHKFLILPFLLLASIFLIPPLLTAASPGAAVKENPANHLTGKETISQDLPKELGAELKFLLNPELVLGEDHLFSTDFSALFQLEESYTPIQVLYLDTGEGDFRKEGWINRIRLKDGKKKLELTCKKRYPVLGEDVTSALLAARSDGFSLTDGRYALELDWSYSSLQLSLTHEEKTEYEDLEDLTELSLSEAKRLFQRAMPEEEIYWGNKNPKTKSLPEVEMAGPLTFLRYKGEWEGLPIKAEIWPIPQESTGSDEDIRYLCELSMNQNTYEEACLVRQDLLDFLEEEGILLPQDGEKTGLILKAYLGID